MSLLKPPSFGSRVPDVPHAVSVHIPQWQDMVQFGLGDERVKSRLQGGYPRSNLHRDVQRVHERCARRFGDQHDACLLFPDARVAVAGKEYIDKLAHARTSSFNEAQTRVVSLLFDIDTGCDDRDQNCGFTSLQLHALMFPTMLSTFGAAFWRLTGCGMSSRMAEDILAHVEHARPTYVSLKADIPWPNGVTDSDADYAVRQRIADCMERAPIEHRKGSLMRADDVYLYPSGMSAIFNLTRMLQAWPGVKSVVFGFPYELTLKVQQNFAKDYIFYGRGTTEELDLFEDYLHLLSQNDSTVQAVWCECASNTLLKTVDLDRIRRLADRYGFLIIVDDTIACSANVDLLGVADVVVTSLTKSFSGRADVMGGSIALNPASPSYAQLRKMIGFNYVHRVYGRDAVILDTNSKGYLPRVAKMNTNAASLVTSLKSVTRTHPNCPLQRIHYPSTCDWSVNNYRARLRRPEEGFIPGYGGVFTLEFDSVKASAAFFNALSVAKGPSLGAEITLAQPYVQTVFQSEKGWASKYGLNETIVRISVGIEDEQALLRTFLKAIETATSENISSKPDVHIDCSLL